MEKPIVVEKTGEENIEESLNTEIKGNDAPVVKEGKEAAPIVKEKPPVTDPNDPEFDLGLDDKQQPLKFKKSQILEFQKGNMLQKDYTQKTQELAAERANLKEVVEIIEHLKKNPKQAEKIIAILEAKEEAVKEEEFDLEKASADIDKLLKDLPEDDPYAQALRSQKGMIQQTLKVNQQLQARLDALDQSRVSADTSKLQAEADQTLQEVISSTQKALKFTDQEEADYWKKQVLTYLVNSPKEYAEMSKEQFAEYFNKISQNVFNEMNKLGEKRVNAYIKTKTGGGVPVTGGVVPGKPAGQKITTDNLQESLELALGEEENKN